ncbi:MAG: helix-turn-helix transcriptional regulator [Burkholderiaceae bacterium]|nr:helix-turn-helix transcriptional regulator [Burkholderiaceae bacterium]
MHALPSPSTTGPANCGAGALLREWRTRRRRSQMDLALDVGVSPRHLSFIETGRSRPSAAMLLALAERLDLPLRERNRLLLAAGHAPHYSHTDLDHPAMAPVRAALQRLLDAHQPYPGVVLDRHWNVVLANATALQLVRALPPELAAPPLNMMRASLHPQGFAAITANFADWGGYLVDALQRAVADSGDAVLVALRQQVESWPNVRALREAAAQRGGRLVDEAPTLLLPCVLDLPGPAGPQRLSLFTTLTSFGTPRDITLAELAVELFYPADAATEALLRASPGPSA